MKSKRGITLVSLVVTIIVLIILAGVSINLTLGENGIITISKKARENMEFAKVDEERQLNELYAQIVTEGGSSGNASDDAIIRLAQFKREIASAITDMGIDTPENADASTMSSNIRSILGTATADKLSYDNTNSGLTATNLQNAVDELDNDIDDINNSLGNMFAVITATTPNEVNVFSEYISYPEGFNKNNCVVLSVINESDGYFWFDSITHANDVNILTSPFGVRFDDTGIQIRSQTYGTNLNVRIVLMKIA